MSRTEKYEATSNNTRLERAMENLHNWNPKLQVSTFCLGDCTNDSDNDTSLSCKNPYQLLFYVCDNCPRRGIELGLAATLLQNGKEKLEYSLCQKIFMLSAHESEPVDWTQLLRWILDPSITVETGVSCDSLDSGI